MPTITDYNEKSATETGDYFLIADGAASGAFKKVMAQNIALNPVGTKDELALLPTNIKSVIVKRRSLSSTDDSYSGIFHWSDADHSNDVDRDPAGACFVPPDTDTTGESGCWLRQYDNSRIRPHWFGDTRTDETFQLACNFLEEGDGLELLPGDEWLFGEVVKLRTNYTKITATADNPQLLPTIAASSTDITLLAVQARGVNISGIRFQGTSDEYDDWDTDMGSCIGIDWDQTEVSNDAESGGNIDGVVSRCSFIALLWHISAKGRNLKVLNNLFTGGAIAVKADFYLYGSSVKSAFRGFEIIDNRFHSVGAARVYLHDTVTETVCIQFPEVEETIPTGGPAISDNIVHGNHGDWSVGLYQGSVHSLSLKNNLMVKCCGPLVYCDCPSTGRSNLYATAAISNNTYEGRADAGSSSAYYTTPYGIYLSKVAHVLISNNSMIASGLEMIYLDGDSIWNKIDNNMISQANSAYTRTGDAAAIRINDSVYTNIVSNNTILGGTYSSGIYIDDGHDKTICQDNYIEPARNSGKDIDTPGSSTQWGYPAYSYFKCSSDSDEHGSWYLHPFANYNGTRYRRAVLDAFVEIMRGLKLATSFPSSATDTGQTGEIRVSGGYIYFCYDTDKWRRVPVATWGTTSAPATQTATGEKGEIRDDTTYVYLCYDTNKWIRITKDTWGS